ncbi:hypothetical protein [Tardiphaga sp. 841_E9_N1_2]|uniref:hypothetical protein n=1 Tax=Tardiphaga sp. 841_E9_N1_2 TaxID=3240762 RepID=UPI003F253F02
MSEETTTLRNWRTGLGYSLEHVCDLIKDHGLPRPSEAKLSRIERDQDIPPEMLPALESITGLPASALRPDLAKLFLKEAAAQ